MVFLRPVAYRLMNMIASCEMVCSLLHYVVPPKNEQSRLKGLREGGDAQSGRRNRGIDRSEVHAVAGLDTNAKREFANSNTDGQSNLAERMWIKIDKCWRRSFRLSGAIDSVTERPCIDDMSVPLQIMSTKIQANMEMCGNRKLCYLVYLERH